MALYFDVLKPHWSHSSTTGFRNRSSFCFWSYSFTLIALGEVVTLNPRWIPENSSSIESCFSERLGYSMLFVSRIGALMLLICQGHISQLFSFLNLKNQMEALYEIYYDIFECCSLSQFVLKTKLKYKWISLVWVILPIRHWFLFSLEDINLESLMHKENRQFLQVHKGPNPPNHKFTTFALCLWELSSSQNEDAPLSLRRFSMGFKRWIVCHSTTSGMVDRNHFYYKYFKRVYLNLLISATQLAIPICTRPGWR